MLQRVIVTFRYVTTLMTKNEFIFSNHIRLRIARHVIFWGIWCLVYLLLFHYPVHSFKGWNVNEALNTFQKLGMFHFILKTLFFNTLLAVVLPQAAFIYILLYWFLPKYVYKKTNIFSAVFVITSLLLLFFYVFALFKINVTIGNYLFGTSKTITQGYSYDVVKYAVIRDMLTSLSVVIGFALVIKLVKRWWQKQKETEQLIYEKTKAELQLLKAQVHPHFLFNTLNNIYFFTITGSPQAPEMIKKLSGLLHYILNECNQPLVQVDKEIKMIQDYMALEKIRYGEQMNMSIDIQENSSNKMIAPLLLLPFVENSFKHGTSKMITNPWVQLRITIENDFLSFFIMNSRPLEPEFLMQKGNIGLKNVKQRLQMIYPAAHELRIVSEPESFAVYMKIQLKEVTSSSAPGEELKTTPVYAMA